MLPERRAAEIAAEPGELRPVAGGDVHRSVQIEAGIVGVEGDVAVDPRRVRVAADPHGPTAGSATERRAAQRRGLGEAGQGARLLRHRIDVPVAL